MRIDITRDELEAIVDSLKGSPLKCHKHLRERMVKWMDHILHPSTAPDKGGWAPMKKRVPIRSSWPAGIVKRDKKKNWSYSKPQNNVPAKPVKKPLTADEILAGL